MNTRLSELKNSILTIEKKLIFQSICVMSMSRVQIAGIRPFGIALAGVLARKNPIPAILSVMIGNIGSDSAGALKYILGILTYVLTVNFKRIKKRRLKAVTIGASVLFSGLVSMVWTGIFIRDLILIIPEAILVGSLFMLFSEKNKTGLSGYFSEMLIVMASLAGLYGIRLPYIECDISFLIMVLFLMSISHSGGVPSATLSGVVAGFIFYIGKDFAPEMIGTLALSAGIGAILSKMGKIGTATGYLCGMTISVLYMGSLVEMSVSDIFLAPLLFAVLPDREFVKAGSQIVRHFGDGKAWESERIADTLKTVARAVCDLGDGVKIFSDVRPKNKVNQMYEDITERICVGCRYLKICLSDKEEETYNSLEELKNTIEEEGFLDLNNAPIDFCNKCVRAERFLTEFSHSYEKYKQDAVYHGETAGDRNIIAKQYGEISNVIASLSDKVRTKDTEESEQVYSVKVTIGKEAKTGQTTSGDSVVHFEKNNKYYVILCDGMGCGDSAMEESSLTARLFEEFLSAGIEKKSAVNIINSALALKVDRESFSSVDLLEIDLETGDAEFLKIGSAQSYIKTNDEVKTIFSTALPIGILEDVEVKPQKLRLFDGDTVLMLSDGIGEAGNGLLKNEWIKKTLQEELNDTVLSQKIIDGAKARMTVGDDVTDIVVKIKERG